VRHGLKHLLEQQQNWAVCGEARTGREAVEMSRQLEPDVVVLDVAMPDMNGLEATRKIRKYSTKTEVLIFTVHDSEQLIREVLSAGAKGYLLKSDASSGIVAAVTALATHRTYFNWKVSEAILEGFLRAAPALAEGEKGEPLTAREREIVQLLAEGRSNKAIAKGLNVSVKTVETHRASVMRKIGAHSVVDIVRYALINKISEV
jgi:DNA-binding NarL/FixJ family response regulator